MNTFAKLATAAAVAGLMAVPMATPSQAAWSHHHWRGDRGAAAAIGFGAGALVGAAAANAAYGPGYYDEGDAGPGYNSYAYAEPGYGGYGYGANPAYPRAYGTVNNSAVNEQECSMSPGSTGYTPCLNQ